jgi:DNA polymerase III delta prime subunit
MFSVPLQKKLFINEYKPNSINDFFASPKLKTVLRTLLDVDDLNILFIGNVCSGKTILLNTMIREYYNLKPDDNLIENNTNILYINNLKEQGIGFFRSDLKTFSQSASSIYGKKKMVVIDDIDTINEQNQQVLRNYIDKYKHHTHFIAVCTNIQKVIESFQSRVHIIRIEPPNEGQIEEMYEKVVSKEGMVISPEAKEFLFTYCKHSIRSLMNHLEKIWILGKPIDLDICIKLCVSISFQEFEKYIEILKQKQEKKNDDNQIISYAIQILYNFHDQGFSVIDILESMFGFVKSTNILTEEEKYLIIPLFCKYITVFYTVHEDVIELALFTNSLWKILRSSVDRSITI